ncbi:Rieske (2Fe-2S) protein [Burkholderia ambifaria]|uniref:Rieske (2Fe-2S) protein n=2 Tax=Burkholderia ambifaria TaxID=152480 RepID=UPI001588CABF|nr:Rieske 2Fe-2S domain-containing protein [Burkholderia ambifaria]
MSRRIPIAPVDELRPGQRKLVFVDGASIVVFNVDGKVFAVDNSCPHNGASLAGGQLEGLVLRCPAHGMRFDLREGLESKASGLCPKKFPVQEQDGQFVMLVGEPSRTA